MTTIPIILGQKSQVSGCLSTGPAEIKRVELLNANVVIDELNEEFDSTKEYSNRHKVNINQSVNFRKFISEPVGIITSLPKQSFSLYQMHGQIVYGDSNDISKFCERTKLMIEQEILWTIYFLTSKQPNGEKGILAHLGNKPTIIGRLRCSDSIIRLISIYWFGYYSSWDCDCCAPFNWYSLGGAHILI